MTIPNKGLHQAPQKGNKKPAYIRVAQVGLFLALLPLSLGLRGLSWGYHKLREKAIRKAGLYDDSE